MDKESSRTPPLSKVRTKCDNRPVQAVKPIQKVKFHESVKDNNKSSATVYKNKMFSGRKLRNFNNNLIPSSKQESSKPKREMFDPNESKPEIPLFYSILTYFSVLIILPVFGKLQDFLRKIGWVKREGEYRPSEDTKDFPNLYQSYEAFFTRNIYARVRDCFNKPISGVPGGKVDLLNRVPRDKLYQIKYDYPGSSEKQKGNLASYNYLGFANVDGICADSAVTSANFNGVSGGSTEQEIGRNTIHNDLERTCADFLGVEEAMCFGMGFATNSMNIPCLVDEKSLIISDACNHASIITGCRLSGASIKTFKHNDMEHLEYVIREAVLLGNPKRMSRPWNKILIIVEGIYSMEGTICNLGRVMELKKKYNCYVYLDEAHSIGALGETGRGCCEYWGVDPKEVDIMMGTFTKSFGAAGGYIGGKRDLVNYLRKFNHGSTYASTMSPPVAAQAMAALHMVGYTEEGKQKIDQLASNARIFRKALRDFGFLVYGDGDSPVVPMLTMEISKMATFQRMLLDQGLATVVVGFPATPVCENRARFCLSSAHSTEDIKRYLKIIKKVGDELGLAYMKK